MLDVSAKRSHVWTLVWTFHMFFSLLSPVDDSADWRPCAAGPRLCRFPCHQDQRRVCHSVSDTVTISSEVTVVMALRPDDTRTGGDTEEEKKKNCRLSDDSLCLLNHTWASHCSCIISETLWKNRNFTFDEWWVKPRETDDLQFRHGPFFHSQVLLLVKRGKKKLILSFLIKSTEKSLRLAAGNSDSSSLKLPLIIDSPVN